VLYLLFRSPTVAGGPNRLLSRDLLGVPLGSHWLSGAGILSVHGAVFLAVLAVLTAACWSVARVARRALPQPAAAGPASAGQASAGRASAGRASAGRGSAGRASAGQASAGRASAGPGSAGPAPAAVPGAQALTAFGKVAPYLTVVIAAFAPLAGVIYLVTSTGWSAAERLVFAARAKPASPQGLSAGAKGPGAGQASPTN
jgi:YidC/Oxa1 family membrane protein insertase